MPQPGGGAAAFVVETGGDGGVEEAADEGLPIFGDSGDLGIGQFMPLLFAEHPVEVGVVEGHGPGKHDEEDDPQTPHVHGAPGVSDVFDDLWGRVGDGAAEGLGEVLGLHGAGESEVCKLDVLAAIDEDVFALEVSVDDVQGVQVVDGLQELAEHHWACVRWPFFGEGSK